MPHSKGYRDVTKIKINIQKSRIHFMDMEIKKHLDNLTWLELCFQSQVHMVLLIQNDSGHKGIGTTKQG